MPETAKSEPGGSSPPKLTTLSTQHSLAASTDLEGISTAIRQLILDIKGDKGLQSLVRIYQDADAAKRQVLLNTCQRIVKYENPGIYVYPRTRKRQVLLNTCQRIFKYEDPRIFVYPRTRKRSPASLASFRLMDLPAELRLRIAEFALSQKTPLPWHWPTYGKHRMIGSFQDLDKVPSLARACRHLYSEVSSLVWKVNVLAFETYYSGSDYEDMMSGSDLNDADEFSNACEAFRFFLRNSPSTSLKDLRCLTFEIEVPHKKQERLRTLQSAADVFLTIPSADIRIEAGDWFDLGEEITRRQITSTLKSSREFMSHARKIEASLSTINLHGAKRNWRIYPFHGTKTRYLKEQLDGKELETTLRWCKDGI